MNLNIEALVGKIGFHETRNRSHAVPSRKKLWRCCGRPSFYRSSIVAKETHFRAEASRISLPRTGHVDKPREKRTDNTTGHRREVRNDVRPERVACAHRLLTNFTRRASSTISCLRLCCTGVHAPLDPLSLSPSPRFISIVSFSAPLSLSIPYNFLLSPPIRRVYTLEDLRSFLPLFFRFSSTRALRVERYSISLSFFFLFIFVPLSGLDRVS